MGKFLLSSWIFVTYIYVNVPIPNTQILILHFVTITQGEAGASGVISGMRGDCDVRIFVDLGRNSIDI